MTEEELLQVIEKAAEEGAPELDISGNNLAALPPQIGKLTQLKKLIIGKYKYDEDGYVTGTIGNNLTDLPKEIWLLSQLEELQVIGNKLSNLSAEIEQLVNLQFLYLSRNQLSNIPAEIGQLLHLQSLYLNSNELSNIPVEIGQLVNLQFLELCSNKLSNIPAEIGKLVNLQSLEICDNKLSNIPVEIWQLVKLQSLDLSKNQLSNIPAEIWQLVKLQSLDLSFNQLSNIPTEIGQLVNLRFLYLRKNQLNNIPAEIGQLVNLQSLYLTSNQLSNISAKIGQLVNLRSLDLSYNRLSNIPPEIVQLSKLEKFDLRGNPVPIPPEILGAERCSGEPGDVKEILDFYFRVEDSNETKPLYEAKLLIIGEGGAGKTSLAKKIEDENYALERNEKSTKGIDVIQWKFLLDNGHEFRVNIWDFGGQEIYHQTHQFFLTKRSLYALVADTRTENTDFYWWLKVAELLSDSSPVFIIKNEKQDRNTEVNERQLRGEFTNLKEVLATNLETNRGLDEIKQAIKQYISNLPHIGDKSPLPKLWVRVRSALENYSRRRNYLEIGEYYRLCEINQLTDRQEMLRLSRYLHDLGVCLHFQDDSTLKHYVILNPEWGTNAVYKILDNKTVKQNLGCFNQENLAEIWQDDECSNMQDELLQLMMRFKLCYQIPNRYGNYIAPQLLDIEQPEYSWDKSHNLILRYKYEFMPKGILTRLIVETHPWIENQKLAWKNGVVLSKDETRAEVIENYNRREIKVSVSGNRKKELLAVVTHEIDKIHQSFERLQYQTLVPCNCIQCLGTENSYTYPLENLRQRLKAGRYTVECDKSYEFVNVRRLIDDVNLPRDLEYRESQAQETPLQEELEREKQKYLNINQTTMTDHKSSIFINNLSGQQRKKLVNALTDAFPNQSSLKQLLSFEFDKNLDSIAGGNNLQEIVFNLIKTAEAEGWLEELVHRAKSSNPRNSLLIAITQELSLTKFDNFDLYYNQEVDPRAIAISFKQLAENHPDAELRIVGMEVKGENNFLLRAKTVPEYDKSKLSAEYFSIYNDLKALAQEEIKALITEKNNQIVRLENMVITALERPSFYAQNYNNQGNTMSDTFNNDLQAANIANFANQIKDNAQQQTNQYIGHQQPVETITGAKTILILAANPRGTSTLRLDEEVREIEDGLQRALKRELFYLKQRWAVRVQDVYQALLDYKPQIVHFSGHGAGEDGLVLEDETGNHKLVNTEALANLFKLFSCIECIILNACYSEAQAKAIVEYVPYVVGMNKAIGDNAAIKFATGFYNAMGAGESVEFAYKLGCNVIQLEGIPEHMAPVLLKK